MIRSQDERYDERHDAHRTSDDNESEPEVEVRMIYFGVSYISINLPEDPEPETYGF